ncbi:MAG: hypothetical protein ACI8ZB_003635 [Desulforhopalus sp.]|jgi:hypothetical protein
MLHPSWITILCVSFAFVAVCNALIATFSAIYYKNIPLARLTHSQLRVKQGNANFEQRLNVFVVSLLFSITGFRILLASFALAASTNFILLALQ